MTDKEGFLKAFQCENSNENIKSKLDEYEKIVLPFYKEKGQSKSMQGANGIEISCRYFLHEAPVGKIIIVTGYNESYLKYAELILNLYSMNYSVYCYDHRGQGYSGKIENQRKRGVIDQFNFLVDDFCNFFKIVKEHEDKNHSIFVVSHSMGGAVVATAVCEKEISPKGLIFSAPMFEIMLSPWHFLEFPVHLIVKSASFLGFSKSYAFGQKDCVPFLPFETNDVTNSNARFSIWRKHISEEESLQMGGPTFGWLSHAIQASQNIRSQGAKNKTSTLFLQAEKDTVVRNSAQDIFCNECPILQKEIIFNSRHEIFMELDYIRENVLQKIKEFISNS